jgi:glycine cleavage system aminomethyltransferase T
MGLDQRWVGIQLDGEISAKTGDRVFSIADIATFREKMYTGSEAGASFNIEKVGTEVGFITSSAKGHSVGKVLALGYIQVTHAWPGNQILVEINKIPTLGKVVQTPFFDPGNVRARARGPRKAVQ